MVVIRLARGGAKNSPFYHVVVTTKTNPRDSRFIERIGYFNPAARGKAIPLELNHDRINYWVAKGAKISDRVTLIIKNQKMQAAKIASK
jgi:small subunit ribosomal protein S16